MLRFMKWVAIVVLALLATTALALGVALLVGSRVPDRSVLHIRFAGELGESEDESLVSLFSEEKRLTVLSVVDAVRRAADDERIRGLLFDIRAAEAQAAQIQEIEAAMAVFRASGKPSIAYLETAGEFDTGNVEYALAACADRVVLSPPGDINLIGVRATTPFLKGTLEKLRIGAYVAKRKEYKSAADTFTSTRMSEPDREQITALVNDVQESIAAHIAARRKVTPEQAAQWIATGPHVGPRAQELGLVDELAYWDEVQTRVEEIAGRDDPLLEIGRYPRRGGPYGSGPQVALIVAEGEIARGRSASGGNGVGSDTLVEAFEAAREAGVKGVLLRIDSPGGSYVASDLIRREVEVTRKAGIPVVASMGGVAASGGYFIAMSADRIVAEPTTLTGSIGVFVAHFDLRPFWEHWLGITFDAYQASPQAGFFSWLELPNTEQKQRIDLFLDRIYSDFVTKAAAGRGLEIEALEASAHGRVWSGRAALERRLIDELGGIDTALASLKQLMKLEAEQSVTLRAFPQPKSPLAVLFETLSARERGDSLLREAAPLLEERPWQGGALRTPLSLTIE